MLHAAIALAVGLSLVGVVIVSTRAVRSTVLSRLFTSRPCGAFVRHVLPRLHLPTRGLPDDVIADGHKRLRLADILLSKSPLGLPAMLTRGFDHAALCIGGDDVAEMTRKGWGKVTWADFCKHSRRVLILRCADFRRYPTDEEYCTSVCLEALKLRDCPYDFQFEFGDRKLTCAELPVAADYEGRLGIPPRVCPVTGTHFVAPQHLLEADNTEVIWDSAGKLSGQVKA